MHPFLKMEKLNVGQIVNTFGIKGELKVSIITDFPYERFKKDKKFYIDDKCLILKTCRYHKGFALLTFNDYEDINLVECFKDKMLCIDKNDIEPLKEGYYFYQLVDLDVINVETNDLIGKVINVENYPAHNILRVKKDNSEILIPYVDAFIKGVDLDNRRILVKVIEGLL